MACEERKQRRLVGVKMSWSMATRVRIVALEEGLPPIMTRRWRKENQVVAAGPKIAVRTCVGRGFGKRGSGKGKEEVKSREAYHRHKEPFFLSASDLDLRGHGAQHLVAQVCLRLRRVPVKRISQLAMCIFERAV